MKICLLLLGLLRTDRRTECLLETNIIVFADFVASVRKTWPVTQNIKYFLFIPNELKDFYLLNFPSVISCLFKILRSLPS